MALSCWGSVQGSRRSLLAQPLLTRDSSVTGSAPKLPRLSRTSAGGSHLHLCFPLTATGAEALSR